MRLLADENFPQAIVDALRFGGDDVLWARTDCIGWMDVSLLEFAEAEARILLTLDKDFWQIGLQRRTPLVRSGVVLFRVHPATAVNLTPLIRAFVAKGHIWVGHVSTISVEGIQMLAARKNS